MTEPPKQLFAPTGARIVGTLENLTGIALITGASAPATAGAPFDLHLLGSTDIDWNSQHSITRNGERLFVDENHQLWTERALSLATAT